MIKIKHIDHVMINIPKGEMQNAIHFFSEVLGFSFIAGNHPNNAEWFRIGNQELHIREEDNINSAQSSRHIAWVVEDLAIAKNFLESRHINIAYSTAIKGRNRLFFRDPWGNRFELLEYLQ